MKQYKCLKRKDIDMKQGLTELVYILDMSGSMLPLKEDTIGGYNSLIAEQKKAKGEAFVTTVLFNDQYIVKCDRENIKDVPEMTEKDYTPLGMTAMLDAIGRTITSVGAKLAAMNEEDRPSLVSVTIITDGMENSSREYTWDSIQTMIKEQRDKYSWVFSFIGANIDVDKVSSDLGIDKRLAKRYTASKSGVANVYQSISKATFGVRNMSASSKNVPMEAVLDSLASDLDEIDESK